MRMRPIGVPFSPRDGVTVTAFFSVAPSPPTTLVCIDLRNLRRAAHRGKRLSSADPSPASAVKSRVGPLPEPTNAHMGLQLAVSLEQRTGSARAIRCASLLIRLYRRHRSAGVALCRQDSNCVKAPMRFAFQEDQSPGLFQQSTGSSGTPQLDYSATSAKGYALSRSGAHMSSGTEDILAAAVPEEAHQI